MEDEDVERVPDPEFAALPDDYGDRQDDDLGLPYPVYDASTSGVVEDREARRLRRRTMTAEEQIADTFLRMRRRNSDSIGRRSE